MTTVQDASSARVQQHKMVRRLIDAFTILFFLIIKSAAEDMQSHGERENTIWR